MAKSTSALRGVLLLSATGAVSQLVGFLYRILLSQMIGAEQMGLYSLIMPLYSVLLSICSVGLCAGVSFLSARYGALGNQKAIWQLRTRALRSFFLLAALPGALLLLFSDAASVYLLGDARTRLGLMLLVPCLLLTGIENIHKNYFYGVGSVAPAALTELCEQFIRALAILGLLSCFLPCGGEKIVGLIVLGMVICEVFSALVQTTLFRRRMGPPAQLVGAGKVPAVLRAELRRVAFPVAATAILGNLIGAANSVLIPRLLVLGGMPRVEAMSRYGVLFGMSLPLLFLPTFFLGALSLVLLPKLSQAQALGKSADVRRRIRRAIAAANLILIPAICLLAAVGPRLGAALYHDERVGQHLSLLAFGVLLSCWQSLLASCLNGLGEQKRCAKISLSCDAGQLLLTLFFVGKQGLGLFGFVCAYVLAGLAGALWFWRDLREKTGLRLPTFDWLLAPGLSGLLAATVARLVYGVLLREGLGLIAGGLLSLLFGALLYLVALQAQGVSLLRALFPRK